MSNPEEYFDAVFRARIAKLENDAKAAGMNFTTICKEVGVSRATPDRWKRGTPRTIEIVAQMEKFVAAERAEKGLD